MVRDGTGDQFKIDICQGQAEIYGTTVRGIINQNVKEVGPESNSIPTEQVHKRRSNPARFVLKEERHDRLGSEALDDSL